MRKINGIYRCGDVSRNFDIEPLVLIHPWYCMESDNVRLWSGEGDYFDNLNGLILNSKNRSIILFEEYFRSSLKASSERVANLRGCGNNFYVVPTGMDTSEPKYTSWKGVSDFVRFFSNKVDVAGGEVRGEHGCAGSAVSEMGKYGIEGKFVKGCCFTV